MDWIIIIGLILFGTFLLIIEIVFVPGATIVGILGFLFSVYGIYLGYDYFGAAIGTMILIGGLILHLTVLIIAFKGRSWERFSLKDTISSKFNEDFRLDLKLGDRGRSISSLKPVGKALFRNKEIEVRSEGNYINENEEIEIIKIESTKIFVQPIN